MPPPTVRQRFANLWLYLKYIAVCTFDSLGVATAIVVTTLISATVFPGPFTAITATCAIAMMIYVQDYEDELPNAGDGTPRLPISGGVLIPMP